MYNVIVGEGYGEMRAPLSEHDVGERWASHGRLLVALNPDGNVIGTVTVTNAGSPLSQLGAAGECEVRLLAVRREFRNRGVARALMERAIRDAKSQRAIALVLSTQSTMIAAQRLYESMGFLRANQRDRVENARQFLAYRFPLTE